MTRDEWKGDNDIHVAGREERGRDPRMIDNDTSKTIEAYIRLWRRCTIADIIEDLDISAVTVRRYIKILKNHKRIVAKPFLGDMRRSFLVPLEAEKK